MLSFTPLLSSTSLVGPSGLEPPTSCLSGTRSNLLSYEPMWLVWCFLHTWRKVLFITPFPSWYLLSFQSAVIRYLAARTPGWWRWWDSNPWPPACRAGALPTELHPHKIWFVVFSVFFGQGRKFVFFLPTKDVGIELFSRTVSRKVFSPLQSLTSVFGMGTGGPSAFVTPTSKNPWSLKIEQHLLFLKFLESPSIVCFCLFSTFKTTQ